MRQPHELEPLFGRTVASRREIEPVVVRVSLRIWIRVTLRTTFSIRICLCLSFWPSKALPMLLGLVASDRARRGATVAFVWRETRASRSADESLAKYHRTANEYTGDQVSNNLE